MKITKEEFEKDILMLADQVKLKENFKQLMEFYKGLPRICEMLIYELFVNNYDNYNQKDDDVFEAYYNLKKKYCTELKEKGFVEFKN